MKKTVLIALCALFTFVACQKTPSAPQTENIEIKEIVFKIAVNHSEDTKAVKTGWADGDKVYVFFEGVTGVKYVTLTRSGSDWGATLTGMTAIELATADPANMYAVFFPYEQPVIASDGGSGVTFKTDNHAPHYAATAGLSIYTYYMTANSTCTVKDNGDGTATLTGTLNMAIPANYVQFFINTNSTNYNADYRYRLSVEGIKPTACVSYADGAFGTKALNAAQPMWGYKHGDDGVAFSGVIDVIDDTWSDSENSHVVYLFDTNDAAKWIAFSGKTLASHKTVNFSTTHPSSCGAFESTVPAATWKYAAKAPGTVTVGLTDWGTFNLGAAAAGTDAENFGWYFQWGNIVPYRGSVADPNGFGGLTYYSSTVAYEALHDQTDNNPATFSLVADGADHWEIYDMAKAFLGSSWRLPTGGPDSESTHLKDSGTDWSGYALIVNATQEDPQYKITFPVSGLILNGSFLRCVYQDNYNDKGNGSVWTSTDVYAETYTDRVNAFNFDKTDIVSEAGVHAKSRNNPYMGFCVRPVKDASASSSPSTNGTGEKLGGWD